MIQGEPAPAKIIPRVLVIFPGALGDLICLLPALRAIARRHPGASLELMAREELARFAVGRTPVSRAHSIDRREVAILFSERGDDLGQAQAFFDAFARIYSFFSADDARFRAALIAAAPGTASFHRFRPDHRGHMCTAYLAEIGAASEPDAVSLDLPPEDIESASRALTSARIGGEFVVIFPGSGSRNKNWPLSSLLALAEQVDRATSAVFVLGPAEVDIESRFAGRRVLKDLPLGTVAAIARRAKAFVGMDSGVSHLAAAAGGRGVILFGPTDPRRWAPQGVVKILHRNPLKLIAPEEVISALGEISP